MPFQFSGPVPAATPRDVTPPSSHLIQLETGLGAGFDRALVGGHAAERRVQSLAHFRGRHRHPPFRRRQRRHPPARPPLHDMPLHDMKPCTCNLLCMPAEGTRLGGDEEPQARRFGPLAGLLLAGLSATVRRRRLRAGRESAPSPPAASPRPSSLPSRRLPASLPSNLGSRECQGGFAESGSRGPAGV